MPMRSPFAFKLHRSQGLHENHRQTIIGEAGTGEQPNRPWGLMEPGNAEYRRPYRVLEASSSPPAKPMRLLAAAYLLGAGLAACGKPDPELVVVLQGWRNAEHAQQVCQRAHTWQQQNRNRIAEVGCESVTACQEMTPLIARCDLDPIADLRAFEDEVLARVAADPQCKGVRMLRVPDRDHPDPAALQVLDKPHWQLSLDYQPGDSSQRWSMTDHVSRANFPKGEGNPSEIAAAICAIVIERGAKLLN